MVALLIFVVLFLGVLVALVVVTYLFAPRRPSEVKERRFEAGGPPYGPVQRRLLMQYFGYIYLVTVVEAVVGLALVAVLTAQPPAPTLYLAIALLLAAVLVVVLRYFKVLNDIKRWG
jgi:NADH-quinone oxidoreductase subunit A